LAAPATTLVAGAADASAPATDAAGLFSAEPAHPRPWPRAILPGSHAPDALAASYGDVPAQPHPFHAFAPRAELQPAPAEPRGASGPRCPRRPTRIAAGPRMAAARDSFPHCPKTKVLGR